MFIEAQIEINTSSQKTRPKPLVAKQLKFIKQKLRDGYQKVLYKKAQVSIHNEKRQY